MNLQQHKFWSRTGAYFSLFALLVNIAGHALLAWQGSVGIFSYPLLFGGFGLPLLSSLMARAVAGCGIKDTGCAYAAVIGFAAGTLGLMFFYYLLGLGIERLVRRVRGL